MLSFSFRNMLLIARREYLERIKTKGFLIATIVIPLLMGSLVFGAAHMASHTKTQSHIAVVTADAAFAADLKQKLETGTNSNIKVDTYAPSSEIRTRLDDALLAKDGTLAGYLWIADASSSKTTEASHFIYKARSAADISTENALEAAIRSVTAREHLLASGIPAADIDTLSTPIKLDTSTSGDTQAAFFSAYLLFFLMYMVIMLYGMNTARSIIEEKSSRVFEVLLATIKPDELLAGKILGVGSVGLTQTGAWMIAAFLVGNSGLGGSLGGSAHAPVTLSQILFFVLYFVFGFLIYSSGAAALGAMTNSEQELQQLNLFLILPLAFCMVMLAPIIKAPDSTLARVVSLIPFCSPLLMNFRLSLTQVPAREIWLSVVLMAVTVVGILWVASRIYRVGILMYGKKPNLPEILRWIRYS